MANPGPQQPYGSPQQPYSFPRQPYGPYPQQPGHSPPPAPGPPVGRRRRFGLPAVISIGFVCFTVGIGIGSGALGPGPTTSTSSALAQATPAAPPPAAQGPTTPTREPAPALEPGTIPNGHWIVPDEVAPGRYRSTGPEEGFIEYCQVTVYDANGDMLEWKNTGEAGSQVLVTIPENAAEVHNSGCGTFTPVG